MKYYDELEIEWQDVETQLRKWGNLLRFGKRLVVKVSFKLVNTSSSAAKRGAKRGRQSATTAMLAENALQLDVEEHSTDQGSIWRHVYALMRCPGPPRKLGPHCWRKPGTSKRYKMKSFYMRRLAEPVQNGHKLESQADVPQEIQRWLEY
ncbi:uncharacterized protein JN550_012634 [Neoarthrinium moseri]|uniref:uncharacterized protein n=1 Tax=Neoarthrinium moseri TaxID=1658444 RepID=UPI001FDC33C7|nr:uncharacterized protein JN550_012634 [Neoarthrinium moseri]KAI1858501.1 hypothetical protein JN550_012634 [Neoarthrinium moseri]